MLKTACIFTGDNFNLVSVDTPASKKKIVALAIAMMVPITIWLFNGFMLSFQVLESGIGWSALTGIVCGTIVFMIEKLIIMANGNGWLTLIRIAIGLIVGLLGSIAIDEVVFKNDINLSMALLKDSSIADSKAAAVIQFMHLNEYETLDKSITEAKGNFDNAEASAIAEADGTNGTRSRGVGNITRLKNIKAEERKADWAKLMAKKQQLDIIKDSTANRAAVIAMSTFAGNALLIRIKALFRLVEGDRYMLIVYIFFTLLMFFFEFLVVILKLTWKKTNYERKMEMIEDIGQRRIEFLLNNKSPLIDPGNYLPQLNQVRESLRKNISLYN